MRINLKEKRKGFAAVFLMIPGLIFLTFILVYLILLRGAISTYAKEFKAAIDLSNLATYKEISQEQLSENGELVFDSANNNIVLQTFKDYMKINFRLDDTMTPFNKNGFINTPITVYRMNIYSVKSDGTITEYDYTSDTSGFSNKYINYSGTIYTPAGTQVKKTSVYVDVKFKINLLNKPFTNHYQSYTGVVN
jgi:hypothetical protein